MIERKPLTLRLNFSWTFLGTAVYVASQWGMLMVIARMGTPGMVGQFALGLAICAPVLMFTNLQLQTVQATDAEGRNRFGEYLALRIVTTTLALVVISGIVYFAGYERETALVILVMGLAKAFESGSDVLYGLFMQRERMDRMARSMILKGFLSLAALGLGVYLTGSVLWGVAGLALSWASVLIFHDLPASAGLLGVSSGTSGVGQAARSGMKPIWSGGKLLRLAWLAFPLGFVLTLVSLNTNIPRYFIEWDLGARELGIYAAMSYVTIAGLALVNALGQAASPRLSQLYAGGRSSEYVRLLSKLVGIGVILGACGVLASLVGGREILALVYGSEYARQAEVFVYLMVAAGISYVGSFLGYGMTSARYFAIQMPLFAAVGCTTALICLWLVPIYGLEGAAVALIASSVIMLCGGLAIVAHAVRRISKVGGDKSGE